MEMKRGLWICWFHFYIDHVWTYTTSDADSLYTGITFGYNSLIRPSATVAVSVDFQLTSINYLDTSTQEFSVSGWVNAEWTDTRFSWVASSNGNIEEMYLDETTCWNPNLIVDNLVDTIEPLHADSDIYRVTSSGQVSWSSPGVFKVSCSVDSTHFPYDVQTCFLSVRSIYDDSVARLSYNNTNSIYLTHIHENWELMDSYYSEDTITVNSKTYNNLKFCYKLKRKLSFYFIMIVIPFIMLSFLGVFVFLIPSERDEKVGFSVQLLLSECVLLVMFSDSIPSNSSNTPLLATYIVIMFAVSVQETLISLLCQRIECSGDRDKPLSGAIRTFALICTAITCQRNQNGRYDTEPRLNSRLESQTPETRITLRRSPSTISPDSSLNRPNGELKRTINEHAWQRRRMFAGPDKIFTFKDLSQSLNRLCFVIFLLFWLITTTVIMVILSYSAR